MSDDITKDAIIEATKAVAKDVYNDGLKPAVTEVGKALQTVFGLLNVMLSPLEEMRLTSKHKHQKFIEDMEEEIQKIPEDKLISPPVNIIGPTLEGLKYTIDIQELRGMYMKLLASSMNMDTINDIHPSYVEIIRQLTTDEAKILNTLPKLNRREPILDIETIIPEKKGQFTFYRNVSLIGFEAKCEIPKNISIYINNLCRLGLADIPPLGSLADEWRYDKIYDSDFYKEIIASIPKEYEYHTTKKCFGLTDFGDKFRKICIG